MSVKELAVLYALNSLAVIGDEIGEMVDDHVPASTVTKYIREGFKLPGQTWPGLVGPLAGLKWRPTKREVVNVLSALYGRGGDSFKRRSRRADPFISVIERSGKGNLYRLNRRGVSALCM